MTELYRLPRLVQVLSTMSEMYLAYHYLIGSGIDAGRTNGVLKLAIAMTVNLYHTAKLC